jgi:hypothetical protein
VIDHQYEDHNGRCIYVVATKRGMSLICNHKADAHKPPEPDPREVLLLLVASLTLADHMGDASNDALMALKRIGIEPDCEWEDLGVWLGKKYGTKTLYGTSFEEDPLDE